MGKSLKSDEFLLCKTLNRIIRSLIRTHEINTVIPKLEPGCVLNNLRTMVAYTRKVQRAVKDLKAGLSENTFGLDTKSTVQQHEQMGVSGSLPPHCSQQYAYLTQISNPICRNDD